MSNLFLRSVLNEIPRLLGNLNRNPSSAAYGSFDRAYWLYRSRDFSCARHQEAVLTLALLYANPFPGNIYAGQGRVLEWINAAFRFTASLQRADGSFDEWYPFEHSFVCTAFVTAAVTEAMSTLPGKDIAVCRLTLGMLEKAGRWLACHTESSAYNQLAGGVCALHAAYRLTGDDFFKKAAEKHAATLFSVQSEEGWWPEYGGPDAGYLSLAVDYLARYALSSGDKQMLSALSRATRFLTHFLHLDGSFGGTYMTRNTEYLIPSGIARLACHDGSAQRLFAGAHRALAEGRGIQPVNLDDRYLCFLLSNWLTAGLILKERGGEISRVHGAAVYNPIFFKESGLYVERSGARQVIASMYKGGCFAIYAMAGHYLDSGIETAFRGRPYTTQLFDRHTVVSYTGGTLSAQGLFKPVREPLMNPALLLLFRLFQLSIGRFGAVGVLVKKALRRMMITRSRASSHPFERTIIVEEKEITVIDRFRKEGPDSPVRYGLDVSYPFIPSARYDAVHEGVANTLIPRTATETRNGETVITRIFNF